jgi:P27 family predicted phage terminase small subunit
VRGRKPATIQTAERPAALSATAPSWLSKEAKAEWRRVMPLLQERRILTNADLGSLENYCLAIGTVRQMEKVLTAEGYIVHTDRGPKAHPAVKIQSDAMTRARLLAAELGLTPVSRSRPSVTQDNDDDDDDPLNVS